MDMRQLIAQIDHIENKQILNEDAHYTAAPVDNRPRVSKSNNQTSIYEMLIKEFGYDLNEIGPVQGTPGNPYPPGEPVRTRSAAEIGDTDPVTGVVTPGSFEKNRAQGEKNLQGIKDLFGFGKKEAPAAPAGGAAQPASALPAGMTQAQVDQAQNRTEPEAAGQAVNNTTSGYAGATPAAPGSAAQPAAPAAPSAATPQAQQDAQNRSEPSAAGSKEQMASIMNMQKELGINPDGKIGPKTRDAMARKPEIAAKYADELGGAKQFPGGGGGSAAQPATPAANNSMTPAITAYASRMGLLKNNKPDVAAIKKFQKDNGLKDDGVIGPNTAGAILSAQKPGAGGRGGPTAAQVAPGSAAKPAPTGKPPAPAPAPDRYGMPAASNTAASKDFPADAKQPVKPRPNDPMWAQQWDAKYASGWNPDGSAKNATAPTTSGGRPYTPPAGASPSEQKLEKKLAASGAPVQQGAVSREFEESVRSQDDAILERIRKALYR